MTRLVFMGIDPGTKNFALTITYFENKRYRVKKAVMFKRPIILMDTTVEAETKIFVKEFKRLFLKYKPKNVGIELFMARNFRSNLGVPVNYMIGVLAATCIELGITINPIMPSSWKRDLKKYVIDVKLLYDRSYPVKARFPDHIIDAILLGIFGYRKTFKGIKLAHVQELIECQRNLFILAHPELLIVKRKGPQKKKKSKK